MLNAVQIQEKSSKKTSPTRNNALNILTVQAHRRFEIDESNCPPKHSRGIQAASSVQFAVPIFQGDNVIDDIIDWSGWWEKVAHQCWWWRHGYVMRCSLSKFTALIYVSISACLYGVPQLILALYIQASRTFSNEQWNNHLQWRWHGPLMVRILGGPLRLNERADYNNFSG